MDKGTDNQPRPRPRRSHRSAGRRGVQTRALALLSPGLWVALALMWSPWSPAQAQAPAAPQALPGPAAPVARSRVWPPAVYLGQRFEYRVILKANANLTPLQPTSLQIGPSRLPKALRMPGPIQLQGKTEFQRRQGQVVLKVPLAIFLVPQYGPQKLPPFALPFRTASGRTSLWLPGATFEVRARYAATQRFRLRSDPSLPFLRKKAAREPSHEWRNLPAPPPPPGSKGLPLSWLLGGLSLLVAGLLWGVGMWMRKKPSEDEPLPAPLATARQRLQALQQMPVTDREVLREVTTQMLFVMRDYLHERLPSPTRHLTAYELCQFFALDPNEPEPPVQSPPLPASGPPPWFGGLQQLLHESEAICFGPPTAFTPDQPLLTQHQARRVLELLDAVEAWQSSREQDLAAAGLTDESAPQDDDDDLDPWSAGLNAGA